MAHNNDNFTFSRESGWESKFLVTHPVEEAVLERTVELVEKIIEAAPRQRIGTQDWRSISRNIGGGIEDIDGVPVGYVTVEENPRVRHAMLMEDGWTPRGGMHQEGRHFIKKALESERIE